MLKYFLSRNFHEFYKGVNKTIIVLMVVVPTILFGQTTTPDSSKYVPSQYPTYKPSDRYADPLNNPVNPSPLLFNDDTDVDMTIDRSGTYTIEEKKGDVGYRPPSQMSFEEYNDYQDTRIIRDYWKGKSQGADGESAVAGKRIIPKIYLSPAFDRIFGGSYVDIRPNGYVTLDFGGRWQRTDDPTRSVRQQKNGGFNYNQQMGLNLVGNVGEKLSISANFDNNNTFDFQNNMKIEFTGFEEDIIKKLEIGNVSLPTTNSLIRGSQALFGVKAELQFGKLFVTTILSRQQGKSESLTLSGSSNGEGAGAGREFSILSSEYMENRLFFLGHYFRDNYEFWLRGIPNISSPVFFPEGRIEVYKLSRSTETEGLRNVLAFTDLGENGNMPAENGELWNEITSPANINALRARSSDPSKDLNRGYKEGEDYERFSSARRLSPNEFSVNQRLGYIILNSELTAGEAIAVAYEYTLNGQKKTVGELTETYGGKVTENQNIFFKLIRPIENRPDLRTWDLMMKNAYQIGSNIDPLDFELKVYYRDDDAGLERTALNEGPIINKQLINQLGLDRLGPQNDQLTNGDGNFDFVEGVTVSPENGYIIFPYLEPFGSRMEELLQGDPNTEDLVDKYVYDTLYEDVHDNVYQISEKNKYYLKGRFTGGRGASSGGNIQLPGFNIAEGSVVVTAGSTVLTEGVDYTVNYGTGQVSILNDSYTSSGKDINVSYEKSDLFNFRSRWMTGARFDYKLSDDINIGATYLQLNERAGGISRYRVGQEPIRNKKYGLDFSVDKESRFLTKMIDKLPLITTKENSNVSLSAEFAQIVPGTTNKINGEQTSFIDDFESAITPINLGAVTEWKLGSTPSTSLGFGKDFNADSDSLDNSSKRAKLAWYQIDRQFFTSGSRRPDNITNEDLENHYQAPIPFNEIFRNRDAQIAQQNQQTFDLAYFPKERGQYNYVSDAEIAQNPEDNYGAITRSTGGQTNFSNMQYLEFWMLDPFLDDADAILPLDGVTTPNTNNGGKLVFNLGKISEDILPDNRHAFENGLPADGGISNLVDETLWGRVTNRQYLNNAFERDPDSRPNQDVGLDGVSREQEQSFFSATPAGSLPDPSADNFRHYLDGFYDDTDGSIIERYKDFNGMDGNTDIVNRQDGNLLIGTLESDNEDVNDDNTITRGEEFFEYEVPLFRGMDVGNTRSPFIVDKVVSEDRRRTWYLVRIPIQESDSRKIVGNPKMTAVQFIRMYMTGFTDPVVLRMTKFQVAASQWQKFNEPLGFRGLQQQTDPTAQVDDIEISVVNIEENFSAEEGKSAYRIPPGLSRDRDNTTAVQRRDNEQSIQICMDDLKDGDAKAIFRSAPLDLINYGRVKMFLHAEKNGFSTLDDDDVHGFLRLMTDRADHYYEIEVPLKLTTIGTTIDTEIWPEENEINVELAELKALKVRRDDQQARIDVPFEGQLGRYTIRVFGNPRVDELSSIMIGARNPRDDGASKSICIWANELRLTDFDDTRGWASNVRFQTKLADIGRLSINGNYTSFGFGSLEQNISERTREESIGYDITTTLQLDKLIPGKHGLNVPMTLTYEKDRSTPKFDPRRSDIELDATLRTFDSETEREAYKRNVEDRRELRGIAFNNVSKQRVNPDSREDVWDIENFNVSFSHQEEVSSDYRTQSTVRRSTRGALGYNFNLGEHSIEPFKNTEGVLSSPWFKWFKEININPLPSQVSFDMALNRRFRRTIQYDAEFNAIDPIYEKFFTFNRNYGLGWALTKSINLNYTASANAIIDEPEGEIVTEEQEQEVLNNLLDGGRLKNYNHTATATYQLPFDKFPLTDWLSANANYSAGFDWTSSPDAPTGSDTILTQADTLGHKMGNNRTRSITGKLDLNKLYNKVKFLKEINQASKKRNTSRGPVPPGFKKDTTENKKRELPQVTKSFLRLLMTVKDINFSYSQTEGTSIPGFSDRPEFFGLTSGFDAPGWGFVLGDQDVNIMDDLARSGYISTSAFLTDQFAQNKQENLSLKTSLEPIKDFRIQLDAKRTNVDTYTDNFRFVQDSSEYIHLSPNRTGSYNISFNSISTAFKRDDGDNNSPTFDRFLSNAESLLERRELERSDTLSQQVLIPAFISAYSGRDSRGVRLSSFPRIPIPSWRVDYNGLGKIPALSERFSSITLRHGYSSDFSIGNYVALNPTFEEDNLTRGITSFTTNRTDSVADFLVTRVSIMERFTPLLGVDIKTKGQTNIRLDYKRTRNLGLDITNRQLSEIRNEDVTVDISFAKKNMKLPFRNREGAIISLNNDVQFRIAFTMRDTKTIQRSINQVELAPQDRAPGQGTHTLESVNTITNGSINFQLRPTINYTVNQKVFLTAYIDRQINQPRQSTVRKTASTAGGIQLRFSLAQ